MIVVRIGLYVLALSRFSSTNPCCKHIFMQSQRLQHTIRQI